MKEDDTVPAQAGRWHQLKEERKRLRAEIDALAESSPGAGRKSDMEAERAALEQRIGAIDEELDRIALAAEIERQQDA